MSESESDNLHILTHTCILDQVDFQEPLIDFSEKDNSNDVAGMQEDVPAPTPPVAPLNESEPNPPTAAASVPVPCGSAG